MPKNRNALPRHVVFPPDDRTGECDEWCAPLHLFQEQSADHPDAVFFDVDDFMLMCGWQRAGKPLLLLGKHRYTRRYLNVDMAGDVWRYVPPRKFSDRSPGTYKRLSGIDEAMDNLELCEMPWLNPDRFGHLQGDRCWLR